MICMRRVGSGQITWGKRLFDILLAALLFAPICALCILIACVLLLVQGRPVFHRSARMADTTRTFSLWKFRTMRAVGEDGGVSGGHKSGRVTRIGAVLRAHRLDELPQLWNILRGDMSFVGPRPPLPVVVAAHPAVYAQVLRARPGVTGLASVVFHRHEEQVMAACQTADEAQRIYARRCIPVKAHLDDIYRRNRSLRLDLAILLRTVVGRRRWVDRLLHRKSA